MEQWKEPTFILIQTFGEKQILAIMNTQKDVHITNKSKNIFIPKKLWLKDKMMKIMSNFIMITLTRQHILMISLLAIMYGYIMCVQFGFLNAIFSKKMVLLMWEELKTLRKKDTNINALFVKKLKVEPV